MCFWWWCLRTLRISRASGGFLRRWCTVRGYAGFTCKVGRFGRKFTRKWVRGTCWAGLLRQSQQFVTNFSQQGVESVCWCSIACVTVWAMNGCSEWFYSPKRWYLPWPYFHIWPITLALWYPQGMQEQKEPSRNLPPCLYYISEPLRYCFALWPNFFPGTGNGYGKIWVLPW